MVKRKSCQITNLTSQVRVLPGIPNVNSEPGWRVMDYFPCVSEARVPGSIPGGSTLSRISPEWEAVCKTAVAGSTPERGSIFGGGAHAMDASPASQRGCGSGWKYRKLRRPINEAADPASAHTRPLIKLVSRAFRSPVCHR